MTNLPRLSHSAAANTDPNGRKGTTHADPVAGGEGPPPGRQWTPGKVEGRGCALTA
ncbi:hypothetical protein GCM10010167_68690 [Paractinoplanes deccanensis]